MLNFGAKIGMQDNMSATLQKLLKTQREFSEQTERTNASVRGLGKAKADPVITANDKASGIIASIREGLKEAGAMSETATVGVNAEDEASAVIRSVEDTLDTVNAMVATPEVSLEDNATEDVREIREEMEALNHVRALTRAEVDDEASKKVEEIYEKIKNLTKTVAYPVVHLKDVASEKAGKIKQKLKEIATTYTPQVKVLDRATQGISKIKNTLGGLVKRAYNATVSVKDKATTQINKVRVAMATVGKLVANPLVKVKDGASNVISSIKGKLEQIKENHEARVSLRDQASTGVNELMNSLKTLAKGVVVTIAVKKAGEALIQSLQSGSDLQQSVGGVQTLFGDDADSVIASAEKAYKTAGLSANEYMETVTSFSASLLQSLNGDTAKSAQIADQAITDMADNANKFGTDMESIQNAYQGFAKQNYTMLDNLKLGYGGTKEEMERLLEDASKLSGQKYDISSLSDVYNAIHDIQESLGVAGTTSEEASETFSGSFASMKASVTNLLGNLSTGGDVTGSIEAVVETASTFLFNNALPMIGNVISALPDAVGTAIKNIAPKLKEKGGEVAISIRDGLNAMLPTSMGGVGDILFSSLDKVVSAIAPVVEQVGAVFDEVFPQVLEAVQSTVPLIEPIIEFMSASISALIPVVGGIISTFSQTVSQVMPIVSQVFTSVVSVVTPIIQAVSGLIQSAFPIIQNIITVVTSAIASVMPTISAVFESVGSKVTEIVGVIQEHMGLFQSIVEAVSPVIEAGVGVIATVFSSAWDVISPIVDLAINVFDLLLDCVEAVFPTIQSTIETVWGVISPIIDGIATGLKTVGDAIGGVAEFVGSGVDTVKSWFGFAYGKDRVPYDNYPAVLHEGEKVLTRNQADQYDRALNTRGVTITPVEPVTEGNSGETSKNDATASSVNEETKNVTQNITIEVNNPVITKEADVDKVVEDMVSKFRKLLPNMT
jgi:phage-related protein